MLSNLTVTGPVAWALLGVPVAMLVVAAGLSLRSNASRKNGGLGKLGVLGGGAPGELLESFDDPALGDRPDLGSGLIGFRDATGEPVFATKLDGAAVVKARRMIASMERAKTPDEGLGLLYLQVGEHLCGQGERGDGLEFIRKCIGFAISRKDERLHAQARMALGELAVDDGDLGGACEQWQMARELLTRCGASGKSNKVSAHMHRCGCPTEWVLTDF